MYLWYIEDSKSQLSSGTRLFKTVREIYLHKKEEPLWDEELKRTCWRREMTLSPVLCLWVLKFVAEFPLCSIFVDLLVQVTEKAMAPHSSTLAWKIPWMEQPGRLQSMGLLRVGHDWATSLSLFIFMHWRRKWQPTPVFLPGESQGQRSLVGCRLWGHTESDTTEAT